MEANLEPTQLPEFTAEVAGVFRSAIEEANLQFTVRCPPLPEPVPIDRDMWEKIVLNLLRNAFKFTHEGGIEVGLRSVGDAVELVVSDTGVGIPPEELPKMFNRFHRIQDSRGRTHEGTGIGLALVQELVKLARGIDPRGERAQFRVDLHGVGPRGRVPAQPTSQRGRRAGSGRCPARRETSSSGGTLNLRAGRPGTRKVPDPCGSRRRAAARAAPGLFADDSADMRIRRPDPRGALGG